MPDVQEPAVPGRDPSRSLCGLLPETFRAFLSEWVRFLLPEKRQMTPTAERLATLVRFHANCRPDAGCETCEVIAAMKEQDSLITDLYLVADGVKHDWRCPNNIAAAGTGEVCLRCDRDANEAQAVLNHSGNRSDF